MSDEPSPSFLASNRAAWRAWLEANHASAREIWLVAFKKGTGGPRVEYEDAVEEALCFGWVDGLVRGIDDERFAQRFTPRKPGSRWSESNIRRVRALETAGRMAPAGLAASAGVLSGAVVATPPSGERSTEPPVDLAAALDESPRARETFAALAPGYRREYVAWITSAKRDATRERRVREAVALLLEGKKLGAK